MANEKTTGLQNDIEPTKDPQITAALQRQAMERNHARLTQVLGPLNTALPTGASVIPARLCTPPWTIRRGINPADGWDRFPESESQKRPANQAQESPSQSTSPQVSAQQASESRQSPPIPPTEHQHPASHNGNQSNLSHSPWVAPSTKRFSGGPTQRLSTRRRFSRPVIASTPAKTADGYITVPAPSIPYQYHYPRQDESTSPWVWKPQLPPSYYLPANALGTRTASQNEKEDPMPDGFEKIVAFLRGDAPKSPVQKRPHTEDAEEEEIEGKRQRRV